MVFCTYCGQFFNRGEHLERHILTHTKVRPFKCFTCHMSFTRRDLLKRHYTVHGRDQANPEGLPPNNDTIHEPTGRTPIACSNCAKSKTKCDKKFPCSRCAGRNLECTLRPTRRVSKQINRVMGAIQHGKDGAVSVRNAPPWGNNRENVSIRSTGSSSPPVQLQQQPHLQQGLQQPTLQLHHPHSVSQHSVASYHMGPENERPITGSPPAFFEQVSSSGAASVMPSANIIPPTPMLTNEVVRHTPMSSYEQFTSTDKRSSDQGGSAQFTMDWQQMPIAAGFDIANIAPNISTDSTTIFSGMPDFRQAMPPVHVPIATLHMDCAFPDLELSSSAAMLYSTRQALMSSSAADAPNLGLVITTQDDRSIFRCMTPIPASLFPWTAEAEPEETRKEPQEPRDLEQLGTSVRRW